METKEKPRKTKIQWSAAAEKLLCELWRERIPELRVSRKNGHVYKSIAAEMQTRGFSLMPEDIHVKMNNLIAKYKKEKQKVDCTGGSPSEWPLFFMLHEILGGFKIHNIGALMEESIEFLTAPETSGHSTVTQSHEMESLLIENSRSSELFLTETPVAVTSSRKCARNTKRQHQNKDIDELRSSKSKHQNQDIDELRGSKSKLELQIEEDQVNMRRLLSIEERRNNLLEQFVSDSRNFQNSLLEILKKK